MRKLRYIFKVDEMGNGTVTIEHPPSAPQKIAVYRLSTEMIRDVWMPPEKQLPGGFVVREATGTGSLVLMADLKFGKKPSVRKATGRKATKKHKTKR